MLAWRARSGVLIALLVAMSPPAHAMFADETVGPVSPDVMAIEGSEGPVLPADLNLTLVASGSDPEPPARDGPICVELCLPLDCPPAGGICPSASELTEQIPLGG